MHAAAAAPKYLNSSEVPTDLVKQEENLARKKLLDEGKPADKVDMILRGQINKFLKKYVCSTKDLWGTEKTLPLSSKIQNGVELASYLRVQLGEGIEKSEDNFAAEVAAMTK